MRKVQTNGLAVTYDKTTDELAAMLSGDDMRVFAVACEALSYKTDDKAFEVLKRYLIDSDKSKRLCALKNIFRHPSAEQEKPFLEEALLSDDILFAQNALQVVYDFKIDVADEYIVSAVRKHFSNLYCSFLYALKNLHVCEDHYLQLISLFKEAQTCGQKEVLAEILIENYCPEYAKDLSSLFSADPYPKIRKLQDRI